LGFCFGHSSGDFASVGVVSDFRHVANLSGGRGAKQWKIFKADKMLPVVNPQPKAPRGYVEDFNARSDGASVL
jgi:hypothetical protein